MSCIQEFAKYVLLILNFLLSACAILLVIFGIIYFMEEDDGINVFSDLGNFFSLGILAMIVGVIILFIAAFGCCGTLHENTCLLTLYAIILVILCVIQLVFGIFVVLKIIDRDNFLNYTTDLLDDLFNKTDSSSITTIHKLQEHLSCCGIRNFSDYGDPIDGYPSSCCGRTPCYIPYEIGCSNAFVDAVGKYIAVIGYVAIGFGVVEILGAIFSFMLRYENINNELRLTDKFGNNLESTI